MWSEINKNVLKNEQKLLGNLKKVGGECSFFCLLKEKNFKIMKLLGLLKK